MIQRCPNCDTNLDGKPTCPNCGWQPAPYMPPTKWTKLLAIYAAMVAVFGACGAAIYVGAGAIFHFGPLGGNPIFQVLAIVVLVLIFGKAIMRRMRK